MAQVNLRRLALLGLASTLLRGLAQIKTTVRIPKYDPSMTMYGLSDDRALAGWSRMVAIEEN